MPERTGGAPKPAKSSIPFSGFAHYNFSGFAFYTTKNISPLRGMRIFDRICSAETKQGVNNYEKITYYNNGGSVGWPLCEGGRL